MWYSGAGGKLIHEKNRKQKISWHCPFKRLHYILLHVLQFTAVIVMTVIVFTRLTNQKHIPLHGQFGLAASDYLYATSEVLTVQWWLTGIDDDDGRRSCGGWLWGRRCGIPSGPRALEPARDWLLISITKPLFQVHINNRQFCFVSSNKRKRKLTVFPFLKKYPFLLNCFAFCFCFPKKFDKC